MLALGSLYLAALLLVLSALLSSGYYFEQVPLPALPPDDYEESSNKDTASSNKEDFTKKDLFNLPNEVKPPPTATAASGSEPDPVKPTLTCEYDGKLYPPGKFRLTSCISCDCSDRGQLSCSTEPCQRDPECTLYEQMEGRCCPECVEYGCFHNGTGFPLGAHIPTGDPCQVCYCPWERGNHGRPVCMHLDCPKITECVDAKPPPGKCCPVCPNGGNCWYNDMIIPAGKDVWVDKCKSCFCPEPDETTPAGQRQALCYYHSGCST